MRVLLLSGGGFKGAVQVPVIHHLVAGGAPPWDLVVGVSVGAINGVLVAQHAIDTLWDFWRAIDDATPVNGVRGYLAVALHRGKGLYHLGPVRQKLKAEVSEAALKLPFSCGAVSREDGVYHTFSFGPGAGPAPLGLHEAILGSAAIAGLMEPQPARIAGRPRLLSDGGHVHVLPPVPVGATEVDAVFCTPVHRPTRPTSAVNDVFEAAAWALDSQFALTGARDFADLQDAARQGVRVRVYAPPTEVGTLLAADKETINRRFAVGEEMAAAPIVLGPDGEPRLPPRFADLEARLAPLFAPP